MQEINIFYQDIKVGVLSYESKNDLFYLRYSEYWKENGYALSPHLFLEKEDFEDTTIRNFISNLLPEGESLSELCRIYRIDKNDSFTLLEKIGKEAAGAFCFIKEEQIFDDVIFREIKNDELTQRIKDRKEIPIVIWDEKPRVSVAGVQEKLPVAIIDGKYGFGEGRLASTHILKFGKEELVLNEYLSLKLAGLAGLNVNEVELIKFGTEYVIQVKRFDRVLHSASFVQRLHIIDGCQMLNLPPSFKYEKVYARGNERVGVSLNKIFNLINLTKVPYLAKNQIIDWVCVNLALANADAHGKNISFICSQSAIELAAQRERFK
jgi:serine/threonine-protein kinase HipA